MATCRASASSARPRLGWASNAPSISKTVETFEPAGPFGAKEVGQGPLLPIAPALANAIFDAVGVRIDQVPIEPHMVLAALALARTRFTPLKYASWLLLAVGLTQVSIVAALVVVGWFLALAWRETSLEEAGWLKFNGVQLLLVVWTIAALAGLYTAVERGLLGTPDMQIAGNHSSGGDLHWYQDRIDAVPPQAWTLSLPLLAYRLLMLAWALWLAFALLNWLRWAWAVFSRDGLWRRLTLPVFGRRRRQATPETASSARPADESNE